MRISIGCTLKTSVTSLVFGADEKYLFHLMDTPGHIEQSGEVSVTLPLADGASKQGHALKMGETRQPENFLS